MRGMTETAILFIDVGNTGLKLALGLASGLGERLTMPTEPEEPAEALGQRLVSAIRSLGAEPRKLGGVAVCSVVPAKDKRLAEASSRFLGRRALFAPQGLPIALATRYARPEELGADRLVASYAARRLYDAERLIVVDFGTATTLDCVAGDEHLGGLICPGLASSMQALAKGTAKLPAIDFRVESDTLTIATSPIEGLNLGFMFGFAAMIDGLCRELARAMGGEALVVATGGLAEIVARASKEISGVREDLVLEGLRLAWLARK